jgi:hypothetical protein
MNGLTRAASFGSRNVRRSSNAGAQPVKESNEFGPCRSSGEGGKNVQEHSCGHFSGRKKRQYQNSADSVTLLADVDNLAWSWKTVMVRSLSADSFRIPIFQQVVSMIYRDLFEADSSPAALDFSTIEQRAHKAGQEVARRNPRRAENRTEDQFATLAQSGHLEEPGGSRLRGQFRWIVYLS